MLHRVVLFSILALFLGCSSTKKIKDSESDAPPPSEKKLQIKGGAVEMKLNEDEKIRAKPKSGEAFFELIIDY